MRGAVGGPSFSAGRVGFPFPPPSLKLSGHVINFYAPNHDLETEPYDLPDFLHAAIFSDVRNFFLLKLFSIGPLC